MVHSPECCKTKSDCIDKEHRVVSLFKPVCTKIADTNDIPQMWARIPDDIARLLGHKHHHGNDLQHTHMLQCYSSRDSCMLTNKQTFAHTLIVVVKLAS